MSESMIGAKFKLLTPMLGASAGSVGYVFNEYPDFDEPGKLGVQIIFSNGNLDGFSVDEQNRYLEFVGFDLECIGYCFKNVMKVEQDFRKGYWVW